MKPNLITRSDLEITVQLLSIIREHAQAPLNLEADRLIKIYESMIGPPSGVVIE